MTNRSPFINIDERQSRNAHHKGPARKALVLGPQGSYLRRPRRWAAAMVEFAICLPVIMAITMGTVEACRMIYLRQSIKIAAYECARLAIIPGVRIDDVRNQCDVLLMGRRLRDFSMSCIPTDLSDLKYGDRVSITVEISASSNSLIGNWFFRGARFSESVEIMAEH